jgi:hypothetical protein
VLAASELPLHAEASAQMSVVFPPLPTTAMRSSWWMPKMSMSDSFTPD